MAKNLFIEEITVSNFKTLDSFTAKDFGNINLITGKNNAGKTSLLEAIFLNLGPANPTLVLNILSRRGLAQFSIRESNIKFLFTNYEVIKSLKFKIKTSNYGTRDLEIKLRDAVPGEMRELGAETEKRKSQSEQNLGVEPPKVLEYVSRRVGESNLVSKLLISNSGIFPFGDTRTLYPESVFISSELVPTFDNEINRYDFMNKVNLIPKFEEVLRTMEPSLRRTSLGLNNELPTILADVGNGLAPLTMLGSGSQKLAKLFLALAFANNGVVLIDEFEGSFHYSTLVKIWKSIIQFAQSNNVQIFATTHSGECLKAAYLASQELNTDRLVIHRMERQERETKLFTLSGDKLAAMLQDDWELR